MAIINQRTGYIGYTVHGDGGPVDDQGRVTRAIFSIQYPAKNNDVEFTISTGTSDWAAQTGDNTIIPLSNPTILFQNRDCAIVQFDLQTAYPCDSPLLLVYRSDTASFNIKELTTSRAFVPYTISGHFGFTAEGYGGTTDASGKVNRFIATIPFPVQSVEVVFKISTDPGHWAVRMGSGVVITLKDPVVLYTNKDNAVVQFTMNTPYASNSPGMLMYLSADAKFNITPLVGEAPFYPITNITGIPTQLDVGTPFMLDQAVITPSNASKQSMEWVVVSGPATLNSGALIPNAGGTIKLQVTVKNGGTNKADYIKQFTITAIAAPITIILHPVEYTEVSYGNISGNLSVMASIVTGTLSYQWYVSRTDTNKSGTPIAGATNSVLAIPRDNEPGAYYYFCEITATGGAIPVRTNTAEVNVFVKVKSVSITNKMNEIRQYAPTQINASILPENASNKNIIWSSSDTAIATVSKTGVVTARSTGMVVISASAEDDPSKQDSFTATVIPFVAVNKVTNMPDEVIVGQPIKLAPKVSPTNASCQDIVLSIDSDKGGTGAIISPDNVLSVTSTGLYNLLTVRATVENGSGLGINYDESFQMHVNLAFIPVTGVAMSVAIMYEEETFDIKNGSGVIPYNATNSDLIWSIENAGTTNAYIENGVLYAPHEGSIILLAKVKNGVGEGIDYTQRFSIVVMGNQVAVSDIIDIPEIFSVGIDNEITATVLPENATFKDIIWSISKANNTGATIVDGNKINIKREGNVTIKATIENGISAAEQDRDTNQVNFVKEFTVQCITFVPVQRIDGIPGKMIVGETIDLSKLVTTPSNSTYNTIKWSVKSPGSTGAVISNAGILSIVQAGEFTIQATVENGKAMWGNERDFTQVFTITAENFVAVTDIEDVPIVMYTKEPLELTGTVLPENATFKDIIWSISNAGTTDAVIDENILNATITGRIAIKATIKRGKSLTEDYSKIIYVTADKGIMSDYIPVENIEVSTDSVELNNIVYPEYDDYVEAEPNEKAPGIQVNSQLTESMISFYGLNGENVRVSNLTPFTVMSVPTTEEDEPEEVSVGYYYTDDIVYILSDKSFRWIKKEEVELEDNSEEPGDETTAKEIMFDVVRNFDGTMLYLEAPIRATDEVLYGHDTLLLLPDTAVLTPNGYIIINDGVDDNTDVILNKKWSENIFKVYSDYIIFPDNEHFIRYSNGYVGLKNIYLEPDGSLTIRDEEQYIETSMNPHGIIRTYEPAGGEGADEEPNMIQKIFLPRDCVFNGSTADYIVLPNGYTCSKNDPYTVNEFSEDYIMNNGTVMNETGDITVPDTWHRYTVNSAEYITTEDDTKMLMADGSLLQAANPSLIEYNYICNITVRKLNGLVIAIPVISSNQSNITGLKLATTFTTGNITMANGVKELCFGNTVMNYGIAKITIDNNILSENAYRIPDGSYFADDVLTFPDGSTIDDKHEVVDNKIFIGPFMSIWNPDGTRISDNSIIDLETNKFDQFIVEPDNATNRDIVFSDINISYLSDESSIRYDIAREIRSDNNHFIIAGSDPSKISMLATVKYGTHPLNEDYVQEITIESK